MGKSILEVFACLFSAASIEQSRASSSSQRQERKGAAALVESTVQADANAAPMAVLHPEPDSPLAGAAPSPPTPSMPTPFANPLTCPLEPDAADLSIPETVPRPSSSQTRQATAQRQPSDRGAPSPGPGSRTPHPATNRPVSAAVRFTDAPSGPTAAPPRSIMSSKSLIGAHSGSRTTSRVRMRVQLQEGGTEGEPGPAAAATTAAGEEDPVLSGAVSTAPLKGKADGESRALTQLASRLIAHDVDYRSELEALMAAHGATRESGGAGAGAGRCTTFPRAALEALLSRHSVSLPGSRVALIATLYRAGPDDDEINGVALMRDLDRAAFRHLAVSGVDAGAGTGPGGPGGGAGGQPRLQSQQRSQRQLLDASASRRSLAPPAQLGDKARIISLVSSQLTKDKSFCSQAGGGNAALSAAAHIQDVVEALDLTAVAVPVGTRARYVPATNDPGSFHVPVWSLRAMHCRKQERDRQLLGGEEDDGELRRLGQAGREALRKKITRRSLFQQEEIIACAVVAAARATLEPSLRHAENSIHALSRQPSGASWFRSTQDGSGRSSLRSTQEGAGPATAGATACGDVRRPVDTTLLPGTVEAGQTAEGDAVTRRLRGLGLAPSSSRSGSSSSGEGGSGGGSCSGSGSGSGSCEGSVGPRRRHQAHLLAHRSRSTASLIGSGSAVGMEGGMVVRPVVVVAAARAKPSEGDDKGLSTCTSSPQLAASHGSGSGEACGPTPSPACGSSLPGACAAEPKPRPASPSPDKVQVEVEVRPAQRRVATAQPLPAATDDAASPRSLSTCSPTSSQLPAHGEQPQSQPQSQPQPQAQWHSQPPPTLPSSSLAGPGRLRPVPLPSGQKPHRSATGLPPKPHGQQLALAKAYSSSCVVKPRPDTPLGTDGPSSRAHGGTNRALIAEQGRESQLLCPYPAHTSCSDPPFPPPSALPWSLSSPPATLMDVIREDSETPGPVNSWAQVGRHTETPAEAVLSVRS